MKLAVIRTGSKQYKVKEGDKIKVEKIKGDEGSKIELDDVLLLSDGDKVEVGTPKLDKKIAATILKQSRARKIRVVKYKAKTRYHKAYGHRQHFTELEINKI
ncbi:MAG: 50S ribosomal protein L21 [Patescibacteria group bacterium]|nr:50S ribosomal protein L21 [Patescibacteria group bacterium]